MVSIVVRRAGRRGRRTEANGALLRPLPFADPEQLVAVFTVSGQGARLMVIPGIVHRNGVSCLWQLRAIALRLPEPMAMSKG